MAHPGVHLYRLATYGCPAPLCTVVRVAYSPLYPHPLPPGHRFPMVKYSLIAEQLSYEGTLRPEQFYTPTLLTEDVVLGTHTPDYWHRLKTLALSPSEVRRSGFPLSAQLVVRELTIAQGTLWLAHHALAHGCGLNVAGGTHHAYADRAEGFCLLNDQALAANALLRQGCVQQVLIVDLDVHQGNGTAALFAHEPRVFTFSMHGAKNYPAHKEQSDLDIALPDGTPDGPYLEALASALPRLVDAIRPDLVFYLAGVDVLATDQLGKLALSPQGCRERDRFVLQSLYDRNLPVVVCMGGGYSKRVADTVNAHCETFRLAERIYGH